MSRRSECRLHLTDAGLRCHERPLQVCELRFRRGRLSRRCVSLGCVLGSGAGLDRVALDFRQLREQSLLLLRKVPGFGGPLLGQASGPVHALTGL